MNRKTVAALCVILLLIPIASADTLNITAETYETFADNRSVNITINLTNSTGNPINNTRVNFTTDLGILSASYNYTNESGIAIVNIRSWDLGTAKITAETPNVTNATNVTFVRGPISEIVLSSVLEATVNTTCLITATVYDKTREEFPDNESKWRVMPNVALNFTATSPPDNKWNSHEEYYNASISPSSNTTDENGTTTVMLHLSSRTGSNTIDVNATNEEGEAMTVYRVVIGLVSEPAYVVLNANPQRVSANGIDNSLITGNVTDKFLNPLCSRGSICFNVTGNIVTMPLDWVGEAAITVGPSIYPGNVTVNATYRDEVGNFTNITNETVVEFYVEEPARIIVTADATKISRVGIPGVNESVITATVVDGWDHVLRNRTVDFSTTLGSLSSNTVATNEYGRATVTLQSGTAGDATVTASMLNDSGHLIKGDIIIRIMDEPFISVITTIEPDPAEPGGIINVTTTISGQGNITGTRYAAHAMLALDRSGSMDPDYYAGTPLDVALVTDVSGSMDPDYYNAFWGYESIVEKGFTPYDYQTDGSVSAGSWWSDHFVLNESVNDLKIVVSNNSLKLQLISPGGIVYGHNGGGNNSPSYMWSDNMPGWYWDASIHEWVWHKPYSYPDSWSYSYSADTDFPEQGNWTVLVYNPTASASSFSISSYIEKLSAAKIASRNFNENLVSNDRIGLVSFGGVETGSTKRISVSALTHDIDSIDAAIDDMYASGGTPTGDAINDAKNQLVSQQRSGARPYIILLSDGMPTVGSGWVDGVDYSDSVEYAIAQANSAKNTVINGHHIRIYTIGIGIDVDTAFMKAAASSQSDYYYAANTSQLNEIYYSIAQQISDFDIKTIEYGINGFTPYLHEFSGTGNYSIYINETINDFKVEIDNPDMNVTLFSPSGVTYPDPTKHGYNNRTGYYPTETGKYVWISPISGEYPQTDIDCIEEGNWTINVTGSGNVNITTHIDKKSAAKLASHAFISSLDPTRLDRVGLATYSHSSTNETATQESYVCEGNQWEGYFTVSAYGIYYFNLSWTDASDLDLYLYDGISLLDSSNTSKPEVVSAALSPGKNYRIVVNGTNVVGNDTQFTINVYNTIETVNAGTAAFLGTSTTVDISPVDLNKTFLIVKSSDDRTGSSNANAFTIRGHFIDNDTIEFTREAASGEGKVSYFVIQADNIEVQSGTTTFANGDSQKNVSISHVTDYGTKCFVALSTSSDSSSRDYVCESWVTGNLTANDNLTLRRAASGHSQVTVDWFVIRFTDNTTVETGEVNWTDDHTATQTITSVNTSRTWLYFTSRMSNNGLAHTSIKGEITDSTTLTFSKHSDSTAGTDYVRYFVIEFPEDRGVTVQRGTASVSSGDSTVDIGITAVNRERAFAFVTNDCRGTGTAYARPYWISYFTADNNLKVQRWRTGQPVVHKWQVMEWPEGSSVWTSNAPVNWLEWRAQIDNPLTDSIAGFNPINSSIDSLTADGMTTIDEGLLNANNALTGYENGTIVLMTDGIDNVGYHSMIAEAERAAARNTTIFTVGLGYDIDDGALKQIANITGGEYYFAPNATVLKSIFVGIAGELGNYTAPEPEINIYIGNNTTIDGSFVNITYVSDSANVTYYNCTTERYEYEHPSNPNMTSIENRTILSWDVGNRPVPYQITVGKYWQVLYQLTIDNKSANSIPVIISPSSITYDDSNGTRINETIPEVTVTVGGDATPDISTDSATNLTLSHETESEGPPTRHPPSKPETIVEYACKLTAELTDVNESKVAIGTLVEFRASSGTLYNHTYPESGNDTLLRTFNETTAAANNGGAVVWLCSDAPGTITVWAYHTPENGTRLNASRVVTFNSCESPPIIPPAPEPRGGITLE